MYSIPQTGARRLVLPQVLTEAIVLDAIGVPTG